MATFLRLVASFAWLLLAGAQTQNPKRILTFHPLTSWRHFCVTSMLSRRLLQPHLHRNSSCSSLNCHPHPRASLYPCQTKLWKRQNRLPSPRRQRKTPNGVRKSGGTGQRNTSASVEQVPDIVNMGIVQLQRWMSRFVLEIRKKDGTPYPPESVYHIVCGIMRFVRLNGKPEVGLC